MPRHTAEYWKENLKLSTHVEGGSFLETYRSALEFTRNSLKGFNGSSTHISTGIYFLLEHGDFSAFHRIESDEMWHFYDGYSLRIYDISPQGHLTVHRLGLDFERGETPQLVVPAGHWFASRCEIEQGYALVGCTVAPGFEFSDFELATSRLIEEFPEHSELIKELIR